jgi:hypothetical protein
MKGRVQATDFSATAYYSLLAESLMPTRWAAVGITPEVAFTEYRLKRAGLIVAAPLPTRIAEPRQRDCKCTLMHRPNINAISGKDQTIAESLRDFSLVD